VHGCSVGACSLCVLLLLLLVVVVVCLCMSVCVSMRVCVPRRPHQGHGVWRWWWRVVRQVLDEASEAAFSAVASGDAPRAEAALRIALEPPPSLPDSVQSAVAASTGSLPHKASGAAAGAGGASMSTSAAAKASAGDATSHANARDPAGRTVLHMGALLDDEALVRAALSARTKLSMRLGDGRTALHVCAAHGNAATTSLIVDAAKATLAEAGVPLLVVTHLCCVAIAVLCCCVAALLCCATITVVVHPCVWCMFASSIVVCVCVLCCAVPCRIVSCTTRCACWLTLWRCNPTDDDSALLEFLEARDFDHKATALHHALVFGHEDVVEILLSAGADANAPYPHFLGECSTLTLASFCGDPSKASRMCVALIRAPRPVSATEATRTSFPIHTLSGLAGCGDAVTALVARNREAVRSQAATVAATQPVRASHLRGFAELFTAHAKLATQFVSPTLVTAVGAASSSGDSGCVEALAAAGVPLVVRQEVMDDFARAAGKYIVRWHHSTSLHHVVWGTRYCGHVTVVV